MDFALWEQFITLGLMVRIGPLLLIGVGFAIGFGLERYFYDRS
ncbi:MAG: hypothetical protein ACLFVO_13485 [Chloroflexaceae bacterium]